ncbi:MAG: DUF4123 domain-containing protein [Planctomycetota bacterium]
MPDEALTRLLRGQLFGDAEARTYALLDGASVPDLPQRLWEYEPEYDCVFEGELEPDIAEVAPYLVTLEPDAPFTEWVLDRGWGNHWGIFLLSADPIYRLHRHFRRFTLVRDPDDKILYFRYYDPRVLRVYLPLCNPEEMDTVFGPVRCFLLEDEDPAVLLRFSRGRGQPERERIPLEASEAT